MPLRPKCVLHLVRLSYITFTYPNRKWVVWPTRTSFVGSGTCKFVFCTNAIVLPKKLCPNLLLYILAKILSDLNQVWKRTCGRSRANWKGKRGLDLAPQSAWLIGLNRCFRSRPRNINGQIEAELRSTKTPLSPATAAQELWGQQLPGIRTNTVSWRGNLSSCMRSLPSVIQFRSFDR